MPKKVALFNTKSELETNKDSINIAVGNTPAAFIDLAAGTFLPIREKATKISSVVSPSLPVKLNLSPLHSPNFTNLVLSEPQNSDTFDFGIREEYLIKTKRDVAIFGISEIDNNKLWEQLVVGDFPIFDSQETFHYENIDFGQPLTAVESEFVFATVFKTVYNGKTFFNYHSPEYTNLASITSELDLPSLMVAFGLSERAELDKTVGPLNTSNASADNIKFDFKKLLTYDSLIPIEAERITNPTNLKTFLPLHAITEKPAELSSVFLKQKNMMFDTPTFKQDYEQIAKSAPVYNMIQAPLDDFGEVGRILKENNLLFKFMIDIKDTINERGLVDFYQERMPFTKDYYDLILPRQNGRPSFSERTYDNASIDSEAPIRAIDFVDLLISQCNCLDDPILEDCILVSDSKYYSELQKERRYSNKFIINKRIVKAMQQIQQVIETNKPTYKHVMEKRETYSEVLFYRLEKRAGIQDSDNREQEVVQNFYFTNDGDLDVFKIFDSQILIDKTYTYNLFEYRLSFGLDYNYSDVYYSQQFATSEDCALLVSPESPATPVRLLDNFSVSINNVKNRTQAKVTEQASIILYEVPITTQNLTCQPLPPYQPSSVFKVYPSIPNTLFMEVDTETLDGGSVYNAITTDDRIFLRNIKESYGFITDKISNDDKAPLKNIEVRILHSEPNSLTDFERPDRIETFSLDGRFGKLTKSTLQLFLEENIEHFIILRVINEMGAASSTDTIYRVNILSDESFRSLDTSVFFPNKKDEDAIVSYREFSNFLRIKVAEGQRYLPDALVTSTNTDADEYITSGLPKRDSNILKNTFNKKFKFRITSKTSGKKVDLNFTFRSKKE